MLQQIKRLLKHRWMDSAHRVITAQGAHRLSAQVKDSERSHTGEIRVCVEAGLPNSYLLRRAPMRMLVRQRALNLFGKLRVWDTEHNNGVLIYLLLAERSIEVVADRGLNSHVDHAAWSTMVHGLAKALQAQQFEEGLSAAVQEISVLLKKHFPADARDNPNELKDEIVLL